LPRFPNSWMLTGSKLCGIYGKRGWARTGVGLI